MKKKVLIIGAGPAGLTAAYELLKRGEYDVTILEKSKQIGGISKTVRHDDNRMDIGGHRFFSKDQRVMDWWEAIMPMQGAPSVDDRKLNRDVPLEKGGPDPETEDRVMLTRNRVSRIYYQHHFFDYPISLKMETLKTMGFATTMTVGFSYLKTVVHKLPNDNLENFYINSFGKKLYSMFFEGYTEKLWGRHPREIDASWGKQRTKELSIMGILKDMLSKLFMSKEARAKQVQTSLIEEFRYPKFGPGQLWETVAADIQKMGGQVIMDCEVKGIQTADGQVASVRYLTDGEEKQAPADLFFSSMPIKDLVAGMNDVPADVAGIARDLPYRDFVTVGLLVNRLNLKNETKLKTLGNIVPDCWIYVQDTNVKLGRIQIFNNWSPYLVKDPEHTVWIGLEYFCDEGDAFWSMTEQDCVKQAVGELVTMGVLNESDPILDSHRERVQKAYPAYFDSYEQIDQVITYLNGFDNLYCVGRNGQHRYNNMDHSMATAFEAVENIVTGRTDKTNVWNVNTEQEYHEEKKEG
ncbi:MAG: NAD(P)/FAD-dependent oxidoreductase [Eubacteriales bacterium]|nr:NAD(P)/FAD-dependent oxidoreductase [Eubacteriales bacterium]